MLRSDNLEQALGGVISRMHLRRPQLESLRKLHAVMQDLSGPLLQCSSNELISVFQEHYPSWHFSGSCPEITCALATGVGKTRLMGAIIAYLYKSSEASTFFDFSSKDRNNR